MRRVLSTVLVLLAAAMGASPAMSAPATPYDVTFTAIDGKPMPLADYRGKALLVVNTASQCGFTPQYKGLQALWERYRDRGLVVIGVPSNDFGGQEPGQAEEIKQFCETTYRVDFPLADKAVVIGGDAHPFYQWAAGAFGADSRPRWNFHKFVIGADGRPVASFPSRTTPDSDEMRKAVEAALPR